MIRSDGIRPMMACALALGLFAACTSTQVRDETHRNGALKSREAYLPVQGGSRTKHGVQMTWYPDGGKESMDIYSRGYRQGYSVRWHPNGKLAYLTHYTDGVRDGDARHWDESGRLSACVTPERSDCSGDGERGGAALWADIGRGP